MGPMTGRGAGNCRGAAGLGASGRSGGRGFRRWFRATGLPGWLRGGFSSAQGPAAMPSDQEKQALQQQADLLQRQLEQIRQRLTNLNGKDDQGTV